MLAAARRLFYARGYAAVGIEEVAAAAGVSRTTVYARFGDKRALFRAVISEESRRLAVPLEEDVQADGWANIRLRLSAFGLSYLRLVTRPDVVALDRALTREAQTNPDLVADFLQSGPEQVKNAVAHIVRAGVAAGELSRDVDPEQAAEDFVAILIGPLVLADRYGRGEAPSEAEMRRRAEHASDLLVRATRGADPPLRGEPDS